MIRLERHIEPESTEHESEERLESAGVAVRENADGEPDDQDMNQALGILSVINRSDAWNQAENEGEAGRGVLIDDRGVELPRYRATCTAMQRAVQELAWALAPE